MFPTQIEEQILTVAGLAPHFQIELTREGRMDAMTVHVELVSADIDQELRISACRKLGERIKDIVGVTVRINATEPGGVARSQGKAVRILDNRQKG